MRVQSMALIHEKLYQSGNLSEINLHAYIENLAAILFRSYQAQAGQIQFNAQVEDIKVGVDTAVPLGLILNELISNALKHAFPDGRSGIIQVSLRRESPEWVCLACQDYGQGLPEGQSLMNSHSLGLQLVTSLTDQLNGELTVNNSPGAKFVIRFPLGEA
jgi:two-component sensor histidine kinase